MRRLFPFALLLLLIPTVPQSTGGMTQETSNAPSFHFAIICSRRFSISSSNVKSGAPREFVTNFVLG